MNVVFFIGNGFDIALGLKTSYRDFLGWYLEQEDDRSEVIMLKKEIQNDLKNDINSWSDLEIKFGEYANRFNASEKEQYITVHRDIKEKLKLYINMQEEKIDYSDVSVQETMNEVMDFINGFQNSLQSLFQQKFNTQLDMNHLRYFKFINFNYTDTIQMLTDTMYERIQIHGNTDSLVFGVDNTEQIQNEAFLNDYKIQVNLVKPKLNEELQNGLNEATVRCIDNADVIVCFGVSLGDSDVTWWEKITEWLNGNPYRMLVIFWYSEESFDALHQADRLIANENIRKKFLESVGIEPSELYFKNQIFVHIHEGIFESKLINEK